jgi:arylsulfatase A-like enzyme
MVMNTSHPNVVVFFTDQQRWDSSGLHGNPLDLMPNFDRIAMRGTHVANSFTCQPVCGPARSCLQTGMFATNTGCWRNGIPLDPDATTLAKCFKQGGYQTGYVGKWHLGPPEARGSVDEAYRGGYDYWLAANALESTSDIYDTRVYDNDNNEVKLPGYRVDAVTDAAIRYIDDHQREPFFLFISHLEPHFQNHVDDYPPPNGYREKYTGRWIPPDLAALVGSTHQHLGGYWGMVKRLDEAFGRLLDALKSLDILDNTIVLFTSDHGCHFKTRNSEYKRSCHESSIRVPTALTGPGFMGGGHVHELISLVDLPPTLLDAAGLPVPGSMEGRSMLPLLRGERDDWPDDVFIQISEAQTGRAVRTHRWKYCVTSPDGKLDASSDTYMEAELYDLQNDPHELTNLIGFESHEPVADVMRDRLIKWLERAGEDIPKIITAPSRPSGQRTVTARELVD